MGNSNRDHKGCKSNSHDNRLEKDGYQRPSGAGKLGVELQHKLNRMMEEPLIVAVMEARPAEVMRSKKDISVIVTGLLMGSHGFYGAGSGFPDNYQVMIDDAIPVKEVSVVDPITVRLVISTEHAHPGFYDIHFANDVGETLTGFRLLRVVEDNNDK